MTADFLDSENLLIGTSIMNDANAKQVLEALKAEDFAVEENREIFEAVQRIIGRGEAVDPVKVLNESGTDRQRLFELMEVAPANLINLDTHIAAVRKAALRRGVRDVISTADAELV